MNFQEDSVYLNPTAFHQLNDLEYLCHDKQSCSWPHVIKKYLLNSKKALAITSDIPSWKAAAISWLDDKGKCQKNTETEK